MRGEKNYRLPSLGLLYVKFAASNTSFYATRFAHRFASLVADESIKVPKKDGKLDQTDRWQRTPVHWAVLNKHERCLVQLLESGASVGEERSDMGLKGTSLKKETPREIAKRIGWGKEILERYAQIRN